MPVRSAACIPSIVVLANPATNEVSSTTAASISCSSRPMPSTALTVTSVDAIAFGPSIGRP
jgi:hypothetical protein